MSILVEIRSSLVCTKGCIFVHCASVQVCVCVGVLIVFAFCVNIQWFYFIYFLNIFRYFVCVFFPFAETKIANNPRANVLIISVCASLPSASLHIPWKNSDTL